MKAKIALLLLIASGAIPLAQAQPVPIPIAVLHFDGPRRTLNNNITALLIANLSADQRFSLVERAELDKILAEQTLGKSGNTTPETAAHIGELTGARILVTGREFNGGTPDSDIIIVASVMGAENGRVFSHTVKGSGTNLLSMISQLTASITETITSQSASLMPKPEDERALRLQKIIATVKGKKLGAVSIEINEFLGTEREPSHVSEVELGMILQKTGFTVVDEKSDKRADIIITGDAVTSKPEKRGELVSTPATLQIKARETATGKILSLDSQRGTASGLGEQTTAKEALANAADALAERLVPALAK